MTSPATAPERLAGPATAVAAAGRDHGSAAAAIALLARARWRRGWKGYLIWGLLIGVLAGAALTEVAAGQRTATVYDRLVQEVGWDDARLNPRADPAELPRIAALPGVQASYHEWSWVAQVEGPGVRYIDVGAGPADHQGLVDPVIVAGRAADENRTDELVIAEGLAQESGWTVGTQISTRLLTPEEVTRFGVGFGDPDGRSASFTVVGVARLPAFGSGIANTHATEAFYRAHADTASLLTVFVRLPADPAVRDAFCAAATRYLADHPPTLGITGLGPVRVIDTASLVNPSVLTGATVLSTALRIVAIVVALAAALLLLTVVTRQSANDRQDETVERALGLARNGRVFSRVLPFTVTAGVAALTCGAIGLAASGIPPIGGLARLEPHPGFAPQWLVLAAGVVVTAAAVLVIALLGSWWGRARMTGGGNEHGPALRPATRWGDPARAVRPRLSRSPALTVARRLGTGRQRWVAASRIAVLAVFVTGAVASATVAASMARTVDTPARWGWNADLSIVDATPEQIQALALDPRVEAITLVRAATIPLTPGSPATDNPVGTPNGDAILVFGYQDRVGHIPWTVIAGRVPTAADEIALGTVAADRLGLTIGSTMRLPGPTGTATYTVVGTVTVAPASSNPLGDIALTTLDGLGRVDRGQSYDHADVVARPGQAESLIAELGPQAELGLPGRPESVVYLADVRDLPGLGTLIWAGATLALIVSGCAAAVRRGAAEGSILSVLGMTRAYRRTAAVWSTLLVTVPGALLGTVLGVLGGRLVWSASWVSGIAVDATVGWPVLVIALVGPVVVGAGAAAVLAGRPTPGVGRAE